MNCIYLDGHSYTPEDLRALVADRDRWQTEAKRLTKERDEARLRLLSAAGDDLCRLTPEEIRAYSTGAVKIPPKGEFLASCERFHAQIAKESGVLHNCLTLAQMIAENEELRAENARLTAEAADSHAAIVLLATENAATATPEALAALEEAMEPKPDVWAGKCEKCGTEAYRCLLDAGHEGACEIITF